MAEDSTGTIDWKVDLPALASATATVQTEAAKIKDTSARLYSVFNEIMLNWRGGAANSFRAEVPKFVQAEKDLAELLDEAVRRMKLAYDNYVDAEEKNVVSLTPKG
jgi:WXG100 family type VII secretion target